MRRKVPKPVRVTCSARACKRYRSHPEPEPGLRWVWLCPTHWGRLTLDEKRALRRVDRLRRKLGDTEELMRRWVRIWTALVRRSTEGL
jgi:hypothetical protein